MRQSSGTANMDESPGRVSSTAGSETSSNFRSLRNAKDKVVTTSDSTALQSATNVTRDGRHRGRQVKVKDGSNLANEAPPEDEKKEGVDKRRQQVYQAQKRHRNRQAEYVKNLEDELAKLQQLESLASSEKNSLAHQNQKMRELLSAHSLDFQLDSMNLAPPTTLTNDFLPILGTASIDVRNDPDIGHDRTFMDIDWSEFDDINWTSASSTTETSTPTTAKKQSASPAQQEPKQTVKGDSWAAADFILALEWICQDHMLHPGINPNVEPHAECQITGWHGHALTATGSVYEAAFPPPDGTEHWQLPHVEIDKLVKMSENLPLDEEQITPAQAYSAIKDAVPEEKYLRPALEMLKVPLSGIVECLGFGAVMPTDKFLALLDATLLALTGEQGVNGGS